MDTNKSSAISADQRQKGIEMFKDDPNLTVGEVLQRLGIEKSKKTQWMVSKWKGRAEIQAARERLQAQPTTWQEILRLCPDTPTLGGILIDAFYKRINDAEKRAKEAEEASAKWEESAKSWQSMYIHTEKKYEELKKQIEELLAKGKGQISIEELRKL